jgi:U2-associated protein SR140
VDPLFDTDDELGEQDNVSKGSLGQIAKQRLAILLREVTFQRGTIARTMAFAIDHADAATEVSDN